MSVRVDGWIRLEGHEISDLYRTYGTFSHLPKELQHIYYGKTEGRSNGGVSFQILNPTSTTNSAVYRIVDIGEGEYFNISTIDELDEQWGTGGAKDLKRQIEMVMNDSDANHLRTIDITNDKTCWYYVNTDMSIDKSCVIFYDDSEKASIAGSKYDHYAVVLVDKVAQPRVLKIKAEYKGPAIPVTDMFDTKDLIVTAIYDDGEEKVIKYPGYSIEPADRIITLLGQNTIDITFYDDESDLNTTSVYIEGIRKLESITAEWHGGKVAYDRQIDKKFIDVIAHYTDGTERTVTDYVFPEGDIITQENNATILIYYEGKSTQLVIPVFEIKKQSLMVDYNGPKVEIGKTFLTKSSTGTQYLNVIVYYRSSEEDNTIYHDIINIEDCILPEDRTILHEGVNSFSLSYEGLLGTMTATFGVIGFNPDVIVKSIDAEYHGPGLPIGSTISKERITCNVRYSDGTISPVKDFKLTIDGEEISSIMELGVNEITIVYTKDGTDYTDTISIRGIENDTTTENNIFPTQIINQYPKATILNNRFRGPAESIKMNDASRMIIDNLKELYQIFSGLEKQYNEIVEYVEGQNSIKILTLNDVAHIDNQVNVFMTDKHYSTGTYKGDGEER